mgnify:CR=1 FL=1
MASDINRVVLIGRMVKDPELKYTQGGSSVTNFSIANNRTYTVSTGEKKELTSFFNCIAWGKMGEVIVQYCKKGQRIAVEGRLQQRSWDDQNGNKRYVVEVVVENFQFLSAKGGEGAEPHEAAPDTGGMPPAGDNPFTDDDIPF